MPHAVAQAAAALGGGWGYGVSECRWRHHTAMAVSLLLLCMQKVLRWGREKWSMAANSYVTCLHLERQVA
jgi:hypothetical protein